MDSLITVYHAIFKCKLPCGINFKGATTLSENVSIPLKKFLHNIDGIFHLN